MMLLHMSTNRGLRRSLSTSSRVFPGLSESHSSAGPPGICIRSRFPAIHKVFFFFYISPSFLQISTKQMFTTVERFDVLVFLMFKIFNEVSCAHQVCFYLFFYTVKTVKKYYNFKQLIPI